MLDEITWASLIFAGVSTAHGLLVTWLSRRDAEWLRTRLGPGKPAEPSGPKNEGDGAKKETPTDPVLELLSSATGSGAVERLLPFAARTGRGSLAAALAALVLAGATAAVEEKVDDGSECPDKCPATQPEGE